MALDAVVATAVESGLTQKTIRDKLRILQGSRTTRRRTIFENCRKLVKNQFRPRGARMLFVIATTVCVFRRRNFSIRKLRQFNFFHARRCLTAASVFFLLVTVGGQAIAQNQSADSALVFDGAQRSYSAAIQVEPRPDSSAPSFRPRPVAGENYLPPAPPASMFTASSGKARFRVPGSGTLTAAPRPPQLEMKTSSVSDQAFERPGPDDSDEGNPFEQTNISNDSGTFAANRPVTIQQGFKAPSVQNSTERFGKFGASSGEPDNRSDRFAPRARTASNTKFPPLPKQGRPVGFEPQPKVVGPPAGLRSQSFGGGEAKSPPRRTSSGAGMGLPEPAKGFRSNLPDNSSGFAALPRKEITQPFRSPADQKTSNAMAEFVSNQTQKAAQPPANKNPLVSSARAFSQPDSTMQSSTLNGQTELASFQSGATAVGAGDPLTARPEIRKPNSFNAPSRIGQPSSNSRVSLRDNGFDRPIANAERFGASSNSLREPSIRAGRLAPARASLGSPISNKPLKSIRVSEEPVVPATQVAEKSVFQSTPQSTPPAGTPQATAANMAAASKSVDRTEIEFARSQFTQIQALSAGGNGTPVRLVEMFMEPLPPNQRKQMAAQYWESYYDLASLKIISDYQQWLASISTSNQVDKMLLSAAQQMAADRRLAAEIQLGKSQSRLLDFMPNPRGPNFLPVPADQPLVEQYVTDIQKYARVRNVPNSLRGIDPMLERTLTLITHRAATVAAARKAADQTLQATQSRQATLASAIAAGKLWRDARMDMVASAVNYNQAISDFILTLEPNRSPAQLSAFMLGVPQRNSPAAGKRPQSVVNSNQAINGQPVRSAVNPAAWR